MTVEGLDPRTLLVDVNLRDDVRLDKTFIASIKAHGVLQPITGVRTAEGQVRVRFGHRRALAAIEAGQPTVPVIVAADEATDDTAQVQRILDQYAENEDRIGLSTAEKIGAVEQLAAFGISAAQISKRTRMRRGDVDAALAVAKSDYAQEVAATTDNLDLTQIAVIAEFDDDHEAVRVLMQAPAGQFDHVAQRLRDRRAEEAEREAVAAPLREAGLTVIDQPGFGTPVTKLTDLTDDDDTTRQQIEPDGHASCPGHAAYISEQWVWVSDSDTVQGADSALTTDEEDEEPEGSGYEQRLMAPVYVCADPTRYGHRHRWGHTSDRTQVAAADKTEQQREADRAARRDVIASNRAWKSAQTVRRTWLRTFLARKTAPKGTITFLAIALAHGDQVIRRALEGGHGLARDLLGLDTGSSSWGTGTKQLLGLLEGATDSRTQVILLGLLLAAHEDATGTDSWRHVDGGTSRYLEFLAANGYTLSDVERRAAGQPTEEAT